MSECTGRNLLLFGPSGELAVEQQDRREQENGRGKAANARVIEVP
jgi:hypothetical protein